MNLQMEPLLSIIVEPFLLVLVAAAVAAAVLTMTKIVPDLPLVVAAVVVPVSQQDLVVQVEQVVVMGEMVAIVV